MGVVINTIISPTLNFYFELELYQESIEKVYVLNESIFCKAKVFSEQVLVEAQVEGYKTGIYKGKVTEIKNNESN
ncbi:MAG: hypothetical protein COB12_13195 [Flavobacterium sp.]|nr:MAG: hypothetical protein COB60_05665 [Flavobacteriaceae bacterium]PHS60417.1 MAG: hypothetical protein COB12_13195 [Flavobacterium sp.]